MARGAKNPRTRSGSKGGRTARRKERASAFVCGARTPERSRLGGAPKVLRSTALNWRKERKPAAKATSVMGRRVSSIRRRAKWARRGGGAPSGGGPPGGRKRRR